MPALALISKDRGLYEQLERALEGSVWSVRWFESDSRRNELARHDVVVVDAETATTAETHGKPVLMVVGQAPADGTAQQVDDLLFLPIREAELVSRLERLLARAPSGTERSRDRLANIEFLESLIDASVDAIVATDMEHRVLLFNPSAEEISGRHVSDVVGKLTLSDFLGASSTELVLRRLVAPSHGGEGRLEPTMLDLVDVHGQHVPVQLSASLVYERGEPSAIMLIFADLRDRIRVEERLAEAQKKLAFGEKQGVWAELAGTAAHELNQPLTSMMAYAELLQRQSEPGSAAAKAAEVLIREAERMADIVRKIGKITRYETTAYVGHQKIFDLDRAADTQGEPGAKG